jgi:hypothetical protein
MKFPWSREECKHLVKFQSTTIDIAGLSLHNVFSLVGKSINLRFYKIQRRPCNTGYESFSERGRKQSSNIIKIKKIL